MGKDTGLLQDWPLLVRLERAEQEVEVESRLLADGLARGAHGPWRPRGKLCTLALENTALTVGSLKSLKLWARNKVLSSVRSSLVRNPPSHSVMIPSEPITFSHLCF